MSESGQHVYLTRYERLREMLDQRLGALSRDGQIEYLMTAERWDYEACLERTSEKQLNYRYEVLIEDIIQEGNRAILALLDINAQPRSIEIIALLDLASRKEEAERFLGMRFATYQVTREGPALKVA